LISVRCFQSLEDAAALRVAVNAINLAAPRPDPFSTFEFYENFLRHEVRGVRAQARRPWFLAAFRGEQLVGYLALREYVRQFFGVDTTTLGFLVTHGADRPHIVARAEDLPEVTAAFCSYLFSRGHEWSLLDLHQQDAASPLFAPREAVDRNRYMVRDWPSLENCSVRIRWSTSGEYFKALSKKMRSNVGRHARSLLSLGRMELLASSDLHVNAALFELYRCVEPHSWKAQAHLSLDHNRIAYFNGLLQPEQPMRIAIQVLLLDGLPVAGLITGAFMDGLYALHTAFDQRLSRFGAGTFMLWLGMRQAIEGRCAFFNLLSGFRYYKVRWLADVTETRSAQIYRLGSLPCWHRRLGDLRRRILPAHDPQAGLLFNPTRRESDLEAVRPRVGTQDEIRRIATLVETIKANGSDVWTPAQLAAVVPAEKVRLRTVAPVAPVAPRARPSLLTR
jgi:hypothetical protein